MSKSMLVTVPVVLHVVDFWPLGRQGSRTTLLLEKLPLLVLSLATAAITLVAQKTSGALMEDLSLGVRLENGVLGAAAYLRMMVWPAKLSVLYPLPSRSVPSWKVAAAIVRGEKRPPRLARPSPCSPAGSGTVALPSSGSSSGDRPCGPAPSR
jgi:hypothetical protein